MHQYNLGVEEGGEDGELVVSKVFYQLSSKQTGTPEMDSVTEEASDALTIRSDPITPITNPPLPRCLMNSPCDTEQNGTISHDQVSHATDNEDRANKLIALSFFLFLTILHAVALLNFTQEGECSTSTLRPMVEAGNRAGCSAGASTAGDFNEDLLQRCEFPEDPVPTLDDTLPFLYTDETDLFSWEVSVLCS